MILLVGAKKAFDKIIKTRVIRIMEETTSAMEMIIAPITEGCCEDLVTSVM